MTEKPDYSALREAAEKTSETGLSWGQIEERLNQFHFIADPETILALLDERDALDENASGLAAIVQEQLDRANSADAEAAALRKALTDLRANAYPPEWSVASSKPYEAACAQADALLGVVPASEARPTTHDFHPHPKYPWFCAYCGYPPHETLKHTPEGDRS